MNKNKSTPFIIGGAVIVIALLAVFASHRGQITAVPAPASTTGISTPTASTTGTTTTTSKTATTKSATEFTLVDVAAHNSRSDCWTTINGSVYNVTSWIDQHPGGAEAIISLCGIDGSAAFNGQHGGQRRPASELATFKIGTLSK